MGTVDREGSGSRSGRFGRYHVLGRLGQGGMGTVYLVEDESGARFALKSMTSKGVSSADYVHRFLRETRIALVLRHPNVVRTYDTGHASDGTLYIVSEYCRRGNLEHWLDANGPLDVALCLHWMAGVANALDYVWREHSMVHRDVKPANLLLDGEGRIKLADLGLAKRLNPGATNLTAEGTTLGSVKYTSPEQSQGRADMDVRSDLYSVGASFYHMLRGEPMFTSRTHAGLMLQHAKDPPPPLGEYRKDIPESLVRLIHRLVEKAPVDRPKDPAELLGELEAVADEVGIDLGSYTLESGHDPQDLTVVLDEKDTECGGEVAPGERHVATGVAGPAAPTAVLPGPRGVMALRRKGPASPWPGARALLQVTDAEVPRTWDVAIYTSFPARFGRARDEQVHMPVRLYPLESYREASMRISSVHGEFDRCGEWWSVKDLASRNGISLNGAAIAQDMPKQLTQKAEVRLSSAIVMECRALTQLDASLVTVDGDGLRPARSPALVVLRPENRPEVAYVLVAQCLPIGGDDPGTALVPPGMNSPRAGTLWWYEQSFLWQAHQSSTLEGRAPGSCWDAAGLHFCLREFTYDIFR